MLKIIWFELKSLAIAYAINLVIYFVYGVMFGGYVFMTWLVITLLRRGFRD